MGMCKHMLSFREWKKAIGVKVILIFEIKLDKAHFLAKYNQFL